MTDNKTDARHLADLLARCRAELEKLKAEKDAAAAAERKACAEVCEESRLLLSKTQAEAFQSGNDVQGNRLHAAQCAVLDLAEAIRARANTDALEAVRQEARDEALRKAAEAWRQLRYVAVQNTNDPEEWAALIARMDAALFPAGQEGDE